MFKLKVWLVFLLAALLLGVISGCEGEGYSIETDEEFKEAVDEALEEISRGVKTLEATYDEMSEEFADRYSREEIEQFMKTRAEQIEEELTTRTEAIEQRISELDEELNENLNEMSDISDEEVRQELESTLEPLLNRINELEDELEEEVDRYQRIETLEELEKQLEEVIALINEAL